MRTAGAALAASAESVASAALNRLFSVLYDWLKARSGRFAFRARVTHTLYDQSFRSHGTALGAFSSIQ